MAKKKENVKVESVAEVEEQTPQTTFYSGTIEDICADDTVVENVEEGE